MNKPSREIKQDINFLEYPLWFNKRGDIRDSTWEVLKGYEFTYFVKPNKSDILILLALLSLSQEQGYSETLECSRYKILKMCGFSPNPENYKRLEDSLHCWTKASVNFKGTFYDGKTYITKGFHILKGNISKNGTVEVRFDDDWLLTIKSSTYFKTINFELYKALKRPISRRLYEILRKSFIGRSSWRISLVKLGNKLTLQGREKNGKEVLFASDVVKKIEPAINEINKLSQDPDIMKKTGIKARNLFTITHKITGEKQEQVITFFRHTKLADVKESKEKESIESLFAITKKKSEELNEKIRNYYLSHGFEYIKWNLLYANQNSSKNYISYAKQSLENNWAKEWAEGKKKEIVTEVKKQNIIEEIDNKREKVLEIIKTKEPKKYDGMDFIVMEDYGIYLEEVNALLVWKDVVLKKFT